MLYVSVPSGLDRYPQDSMQPRAMSTADLARELAAAMLALDDAQQRVAIALYRLLAEGEPVAPGRLAERAGVLTDETRELLEGWPGVYLEDGRVVGFWGLALDRMPHRLYVDGRELRAWCAWDTLFLPELIGKPARVESSCPTTGETISLEVVPGVGVRDVLPSTAVLSLLRREEPFDADMIISFCHFVHFFRDEEAAHEWTAKREGTFVISLEDGFEVGHIANRRKFGSALAAADGGPSR